MGYTGPIGNKRLAAVAAVCVVVFMIASVIAAVGYAEWMWLFVFLGLVLPPLVLAIVIGTAVKRRFFNA